MENLKAKLTELQADLSGEEAELVGQFLEVANGNATVVSNSLAEDPGNTDTPSDEGDAEKAETTDAEKAEEEEKVQE